MGAEITVISANRARGYRTAFVHVSPLRARDMGHMLSLSTGTQSLDLLSLRVHEFDLQSPTSKSKSRILAPIAYLISWRPVDVEMTGCSFVDPA
jgi:hypothetical protein